MTEIKCDVCSRCIRGAVFELRDPTGEWSFEYDNWDICSVECLATAATMIAFRNGGQREHEAVMSKVNNAPAKFKKWWNR